MMRAAAIGFALVTASAFAQETGPHGPGPWAVLLTEVAILEGPPPKKSADLVVPIRNAGEPKVLLIPFATIEACQNARNGPLNPTSFDIPLGTGGGGTAHVGRSVSECFQQ